MVTITLGPGAGTTRAYKAQAVYTRARWADAWVLNAKIAAIQVTWSVAPSLPSATLVFDYGSIKEPGLGAFVAVSKLSIGRHYVRILYTDDASNSWDWVGFFDIDDDSIFGTDKFGGRQTLIAYGIEKTLADHAVDKTVSGERVGPDLTLREPVHAATFNRGGQGNRNVGAKAPAPDNAYFFEPNLFDNGGNFWNSAQIIEHLLAFHTPRDEVNAIQVPIEFDSTNVATWDNPVLPTSQMSTYALIERLIDRRRLLVWWLEYNSTSDVMTWKAASLAAAAITLPIDGDPVFPVNANKVDLDFDQDQFTQATIRREFDRYHRVIARGARRISIGSFSLDDGTLVRGWDLDGNGTLEGEYNSGASGSAGYDDLSKDAKQKLNAKVRSDPRLADVYSLWTVPFYWDGEVRDGTHSIEPNPIFPDSPDFYFPETFVLPSLPLLAGVDYEGDPVLAEEPAINAEELSPLVVVQVKGTTTWMRAEELGGAAMAADESDDNPDWSLSVFVPLDSHALRLKVIGKPQYFLFWESGSKYLTDDPRARNGLNFGRAGNSGIATLAIYDPRYAEGVASTAAVVVDILRTKIIWLGDSYRQVYIAPQTIVGVDEAGALKRSDGGYLHDDTNLLESIAKIAADWYTIDRRVLDLRTTRILDSSTIGLGYMVENVGNVSGGHREAINSVITQIDIQSPIGETVSDPVEMRITTWAGELDLFDATQSAVIPKEVAEISEPFVSPGDDTSFDVGVGF